VSLLFFVSPLLMFVSPLLLFVSPLMLFVSPLLMFVSPFLLFVSQDAGVPVVAETLCADFHHDSLSKKQSGLTLDGLHIVS
jgi:hypothetical protein